MLQICKNLAADRLRQRLNRRKLTLREIVEGGRRVGNRVLHDAILRAEPFFEHADRYPQQALKMPQTSFRHHVEVDFLWTCPGSDVECETTRLRRLVLFGDVALAGVAGHVW